jgi:hypothetical protein
VQTHACLHGGDVVGIESGRGTENHTVRRRGLEHAVDHETAEVSVIASLAVVLACAPANCITGPSITIDAGMSVAL